MTLHKKLQVNITVEHKCENPQQNISKLNSTTYLKGHFTMIMWIHLQDARMVQHMKIYHLINFIKRTKDQGFLLVEIRIAIQGVDIAYTLSSTKLEIRAK
jgi:hypothetical protein